MRFSLKNLKNRHFQALLAVVAVVGGMLLAPLPALADSSSTVTPPTTTTPAGTGTTECQAAKVSDANVAKCDNCNAGFLTFPTWYSGLIGDPNTCSIIAPNLAKGGLSGFIWHIVLNVLDIMLQAVGYIAGFFVLFGGFQYMTSQGVSANVEKAKATLTNAIIGLVLSIVSVAIVNLILGIIK